MTVIKDRDASVNWIVYTKIIDGSLDYFFLNTNGTKGDSGLTGPNTVVYGILILLVLIVIQVVEIILCIIGIQ